MEIVHRISIASNPEIQRELARLGITVGESGFVSFDVDESSSSWLELEEWVSRRRALDIPTTKFSNKEIADAQWLELEPDWHHSYPQPDEAGFGYLNATYDLTNWCGQCGIGMKQKAPFQLKGEPKWSKRSVLQINWVFDEYFATPEAWEQTFKPHGVECRPVMNTKSVELKTVVQLVARGEVGLVADRFPTEEAVCSRCGRTKYLPLARGRFPALRGEPPSSMFKTQEHFGSGASAHRRVLVSQSVAHSLMANRLRGVSLRPVDS